MLGRIVKLLQIAKWMQGKELASASPGWNNLQDGDQLKSELRRQNPQNRSWRAFSLRWPYQFFLLGLSTLLLIAAETLRQASKNNNGIAHFADSVEITTAVTFAYNYLPAIVGTIYSVLWSFVDADAKRLESYFQMSSKKCSVDSLFLDYIFESPFIVPFRALRRRHWTISLISAVYLGISLILPPSQGALLGIQGTVVSRDNEPFNINYHDPNVDDILQGGFIDEAKSIAVYKRATLPPWTTWTHAVAPFSPIDSHTPMNETWIATTKVYYAVPRCHRFEVENYTVAGHSLGSPNGSISSPQEVLTPSGSVLIDDGTITYTVDQLAVAANFSLPDCNITLGVNIYPHSGSEPGGSRLYPISTSRQGPDYSGNYKVSFATISTPVSWVNVSQSTIDGWRQPSVNCPRFDQFEGLLDLRGNNSVLYNISGPEITRANIISKNLDMNFALFACDSEYLAGYAEVEVRGENKEVLLIGNISEPDALRSDQFNSTNFQSVLRWGVDPRAGIVSDSGSSHHNNSHQNHSQGVNSVNPESLNFYGESLAMLALRNATVPPDNVSSSTGDDILMQGDNFGRVTENVLKMVSALMFSSIIGNSSVTQNITGTVNTDVYAIIVNPVFAIISESLCATAILASVILIFVLPRRPNILRSDPDSVAAQLSLLTDVFSGLSLLDDRNSKIDRMSTKELNSHMNNFRLDYNPFKERVSLSPKEQYTYPVSDIRPSKGSTRLNGEQIFSMTKSAVLMGYIFLLLIIFFAFVLLLVSMQKFGFAVLSQLDTFRAQLLWSFLPTLVVTCLELCCITVYRDMSSLEALVQLRGGNTPALNSLSLRYSSRPPLIGFYLSLKKKHLLLCFISLICISTSVLNVLVAGIFQQSFTTVQRVVNMS